MPMVGMAGGSGINCDGAGQQRNPGIIVYNDIPPPLLTSRPPDYWNTYILNDLGAFAYTYLRNIDWPRKQYIREIWMTKMNHIWRNTS